MGHAGLVARMRRRVEGRRSSVCTMDRRLPIAVYSKRIRAAGGMIVAVRSRAPDVVRMLVVAAFKEIARAANDIHRRGQNPSIHGIGQTPGPDDLPVQISRLDVSQGHKHPTDISSFRKRATSVAALGNMPP